MDETEPDDVVTVGQRLREAREAQGMSVEDIAAQTRIPTRHLTSLELGEWDKLPAATYSIGFAKNYAGAVGLDRSEIGEQLRAEMGGTRQIYASPEVYEAADPARSMPKGLVISALGLLVLVVLALSWLSNRSMQADEPAVEAGNVAEPAAIAAAPAVAPTPASAGPVVLIASEPVWLEVKDGNAVLKQGVIAAGESYEVPANAAAPVLTTGKPEALRISVGSAQAPAVGEAGKRVSNVSLKPADVLRGPPGPAATEPEAPPVAASRATPRPAASRSEAPPTAAPPPTTPPEPTQANSAAPAIAQ